MIDNTLFLQLFAEPNTQTTGLNAEHNDLSPEMKTFYRTSLLENARNANYFAQFGQKQGLPKNGGNQVEWRKFDTFKLATTPLTEGVTPDGNKLNMTKITKAIQQFGDYTTVSDLLELRAIDPVIASITEEHGAQAGDTIDIIIRNELVSGTNVIYAPKSDGTEITSRADITADCKLTPTVINRAFTQLKKMKAPTINGDYVAIVHPSVIFDLRESEGWLNAHEYAKPEEIFNGEVGKLHGVRFLETTNQKIWKTTNGAVYACLFLGKDAYGVIEPSAESMEVIVKSRGSAGTADPLDQRSTVGWKCSTAAQILYQERMVRVECGSSFSKVDEAN